MANALVILNEVEFTTDEISGVDFGEENKLYITFSPFPAVIAKADSAVGSSNTLSIEFKQENAPIFSDTTQNFILRLNYSKEIGFQKQLTVTL